MRIYNISQLAGVGADFGILGNAWLDIEDGRITAVGTGGTRGDIDARGGVVMPMFCDPHTHIIYSRPREQEFVDKIRGLSYHEIAARGGGILNSARALAQTPEEKLFDDALGRLSDMMAHGTGAVEIKSGYGLDTESELKMLRVAARLRDAVPIPVKITFLGAHAVPESFHGDTEAYVRHIIQDMLPAVAAQGYADYVDVFCEDGFFNADMTVRICAAAAGYGLRPRIHAAQFRLHDGIRAAVEAGAVSVDHLEIADSDDIALLRRYATVPTVLPGASFFTAPHIYAPAREMLDAGLKVAIASDYNPGTAPSGDMRMMWTLACTQMGLTPLEALRCATQYAALALELPDRGTIAPGQKAALIITAPVPDIAYIPYAYSEPWIERLIFN